MIFARFSETFPRRKCEWLFAFIMFGMGIVFVLNPTLFGRPYFATMRDVMPQGWWALLTLSIGFVRLAALFVNGTMLPLSPMVRFGGSAAAAGIWTALGWAAVHNDFAGLMLAFVPPILAFEFIIVGETVLEWNAASPPKRSEVASGSGSG